MTANYSSRRSSQSDNSTTNVVTATSSEASSLANENDYSDNSIAAAAAKNQQQNNKGNKASKITILSWPDPHTHYIPTEEEERLLPILIHWGKTERGMWKDQPSFRVQKLQKALENRGKQSDTKHHGKKHSSKSKNSALPNASATSTTRRISLIQSLSLRRHHLKLLNPNLSMEKLRLGNGDDIRDAAALFEDSVDIYLRTSGVDFLTEEDQRKEFEQKMKSMGVPYHQRKQPLTPDFMMKEGHSVILSFTSDTSVAGGNGQSGTMHPTSINWIEAKMFYGASTIPSGTPNAVGCVMPKAKQYVSEYGTGAIVFMYGCGRDLAAQLLEVGVVALDGRGFDLGRVEEHQRRWCADGWGDILF